MRSLGAWVAEARLGGCRRGKMRQQTVLPVLQNGSLWGKYFGRLVGAINEILLCSPRGSYFLRPVQNPVLLRHCWGEECAAVYG